MCSLDRKLATSSMPTFLLSLFRLFFLHFTLSTQGQDVVSRLYAAHVKGETNAGVDNLVRTYIYIYETSCRLEHIVVMITCFPSHVFFSV